MSKFEIKIEDFKSFINNLGFKSDFQIDWIGGRKEELSTKILNSPYYFDMYLEHNEIHQLRVDVNDIGLHLYVYYIDGHYEEKNYSYQWRKHLYQVRGQEYYDYFKNYCKKEKSQINKFHDTEFKKLICKIEDYEKARKERLEYFDDMLCDLKDNDLTM